MSNWQFSTRQVLSFVILLCVGWYAVVVLNDHTAQLQHAAIAPLKQYPPDHKLILLWTPSFGHPNWMLHLGKQSFQDHNCPEQRCYLTSNRARASEASIVLFHMRDLRDGVRGLPSQHPVQQRWVFVLMESPVHTYYPISKGHRINADLTPLDGIFNLTATYMPESDVHMPYGGYSRRENKLQNSIGSYQSNITKSGLVLWYVSNCYHRQTKWRKNYARKLQNYIQIDKFGKCGKPDPCKKADDFNACLRDTMNRYKFYLAFENSRCRHYITEKFWKALNVHIIPIVLGSPLEDVEKAAPLDSFLHVDNFSSPENLANYLNYLDSNPDAYNRYFKWKEDFEIRIPPEKASLCKLCEAAHETNMESKTYNISQWYSKKALCTL